MLTTAALLAGVLAASPGRGDPAEVRAFLDAGRYDEAEAAARALVGAAPRAAPAPEEALLLGEALVRNGRIAGHEAEALARGALALQVERHGARSPEAARARASLGSALLSQGDVHAALPLLERAARVLRGRDGEAGALAWLAEARLEATDSRGAIAAADRTLALARSDPTLAAEAANVKIEALQMLGRWKAARALARESLARIDGVRPGHVHGAVTELLLGDSDWRSADMGAAGRHYSRAVEIAAVSLRAAHPLLARAQGRLASWQAETGRLEEALPLHRSAVAAARESLGPDHPRMADFNGDLANSLVYAGDAGAAIPFFDEAVRLTERSHGPRSSAVATPLYNLGLALAEQRRWTAAAATLKRAQDLWRRAYGERDARVLLAGKDRADALAGGGHLRDAVRLYRTALRLRLAAGEGRHPATAALRARLATALEHTDNLREASLLAAQAAEGLRGQAGPADRDYADVQALRARLALRLGRRSALVLGPARDSDEVMRRHIRGTVRFLGERQALEYVGRRFGGRDVMLSLLEARPRDTTSTRAALDLVARSRHLVFDEMARRARRQPTDAGGPVHARAVAAARRVAALLYRGASQQGPEGAALLRTALHESEEASRADALAGARDERQGEFDGDLVSALGQRLEEREVLISFSSFRRAHGGGLAYMALALRRTGSVTAIPLGGAEDIDALVRRWGAAVRQRARAPDDGATRGELDRIDRLLSRRLWMPLAPALAGAERAVLVPDGPLSLLNFAALLDASGRYVLESGPTLHLVSSERDLLRAPDTARAPRLLIVADPAFDDSTVLGQAAAERGLLRCTRLGDLRFGRLPASRSEAADLGRLWRERTGQEADMLMGKAASESGLRDAAPGHTIVHIASHGFVLESACLEPDDVSALDDGRYSPLLLAGIALAGANRRARGEIADDDGILTASEVAALDLSGVQWVVLSGCETGGGEVRAAEGVVGLQRAFATAGARNVVMSLWPVADEDAHAFMAELYAGRLARGRTISDALREAGLRLLSRWSSDGRPADPSRWAAFVAIGDSR